MGGNDTLYVGVGGKCHFTFFFLGGGGGGGLLGFYFLVLNIDSLIHTIFFRVVGGCVSVGQCAFWFWGKNIEFIIVF